MPDINWHRSGSGMAAANADDCYAEHAQDMGVPWLLRFHATRHGCRGAGCAQGRYPARCDCGTLAPHADITGPAQVEVVWGPCDAVCAVGLAACLFGLALSALLG